MSEAEEGDCYIDDRLHYQLSVVARAIVASADHETDALWYWLHPDPASDQPWLRALPET